ncbi:WbuC family cupin fold metalloprotein [Ewingella americana]|jgi:cupin fold WbuC family metalloprotein|uniref:WbuC family cupin fold metalloprotein n=1 Tax=Ewingella americana TaxID=41202 RepID=UPI00163AA3CE|nr:WbuC family cupin fold metalloprotein [Ewingella americana]QMV53407.1 WbuC family cupin fold metalloprotein [Ewingella americana]
MIKQISQDTMCDLITKATNSPRLRQNLNIHPAPEDDVQRLAIAMEPGTYVRVHRHPHTWELLTPLRGRFLVLTYDESGKVTDRLWLGGDTRLLEIPANTWHSVLSLDEGGVIFEVKHGAYQPVTEEDYLPGSAPEGDERVKATLEWYANAEIGDVFAV